MAKQWGSEQLLLRLFAFIYSKKEWLFMDSRLLTMMEGHTGHFGVRRQRYSSP